MATVLSYLLPIIILSPLLILLAFYLRFRLVGSKYWSNSNIPHLKPTFLLGNFWKANIMDNMQQLLKTAHLENRQKKLIGTWLFTKPMLMVTDLDLAKRILIKDFNHFRDRGFNADMENDPLIGNLFFLNGLQWRNLRVKLTPTFTSGKMKFMFPTVVECGNQLQSYLNKSADQKMEIEVKDLLSRLTTDIIASCAFGIQTNSLENPDSEFRKFGKQFFEVDLKVMIKNIIITSCPKLAKALKFRFTNKGITEFFMKAVKDTVEYREKNNVSRNDFLQLLIQLMRAGKVEDVDRNPVDVTEYTDEELVYKFELKEAAAQCFVFFLAGFETSSTALTFALYELALNPDIQKKLQREIDDVLEETYEEIMKMEYLDMVVQETLRKYPPAGNLQRKCNTDYPIPEMNLTIKKGTTLMFSLFGFHYDPDQYLKPDVFDPERFAQEEKNRRHPMAYMPFGEGPRNCIGNRFALMQIKVGLISIFRGFNVEVSKRTPIPLVFEKRSFFPASAGGMHLQFSRRI